MQEILFAVITLLIICGALALLYWAVDKLGTPDPVNRVVKVLAVVVALILIVIVALNMIGYGGGDMPRLSE